MTDNNKSIQDIKNIQEELDNIMEKYYSCCFEAHDVKAFKKFLIDNKETLMDIIK